MRGLFSWYAMIPVQLVRDDTIRPAQEELRVLEKINGQWKIVCVSVIAIEKEKESQPVR